jgi:hypothetical protein
MYKLTFEIPGLPRMTNPSGKSNSHWVRYNEAKKWKAMVGLIVASKRPPTPLEKAKLTLTRFSSVSPDPDGLVSGFKHVIDGLREAGVLANDRYSNIGMPDYRWEKAKQKQGKIKVTVEGEL